jgi:hypothetical protein
MVSSVGHVARPHAKPQLHQTEWLGPSPSPSSLPLDDVAGKVFGRKSGSSGSVANSFFGAILRQFRLLEPT